MFHQLGIAGVARTHLYFFLDNSSFPRKILSFMSNITANPRVILKLLETVNHFVAFEFI